MPTFFFPGKTAKPWNFFFTDRQTHLGTSREKPASAALSTLDAAPVRSHRRSARRAGFVSATLRARATGWRRLRVQIRRRARASRHDRRRRRRRIALGGEDPEAALRGRPQVRFPASPASRGEPRGARGAGFRARDSRAGRDDRASRREQGRRGGGVHRLGQDSGVRPASRGDLGEAGDALPEALRGGHHRLAHARAGEADLRRRRAVLKHRLYTRRRRGDESATGRRDAFGRRNGRRRGRQAVRRTRRRRAHRHARKAGRRHGPL